MSTLANLLVVALLVWGSTALFRWSARRDREPAEHHLSAEEQAPPVGPSPNGPSDPLEAAFHEYVQQGLTQIQAFLALEARSPGTGPRPPDTET